MSRRRKSKARKQWPPEPEDILDGRVEPRFEDLFDLIHRVNPTGERLSKKEETRRYGLKNRLQSLLIRSFGDEHLTLGEDARPGVVSLEHISGARDACHAVIAELEPDARAWVQRRLDLAAMGGEEEDAVEFFPGDDADGETSGDLLQQGARALAEYDYEQGEELLRQAFEASRGGAETQHAAAAEALLELRVDLLGADEAALALTPRLSRAAKERPAIRTLLALAAARQGGVEHSVGLMTGLTPAIAGLSLTRAAEVYAALAAGAIRDHDRSMARRFLDQVSEYDPTHSRILGLEAELDTLRAEDRQAAEAELARRFEELGAEAVEHEARELADRWPEGEVARRILRQLAAERRRAEIAEHLELAERARSAERFAEAARHFQAALEAGSERPGLADLVAELEDRVAEERERREIDGVLRRFDAEGDKQRHAALLAYLTLAGEPRGRIREQLAQPALGWLEEMEAPRSGARAQAAVVAVLSLERASAALERGAAPLAAREIRPHRAALRRVTDAAGVWRRARRRMAEERRRHALEQIEAAESALEEGRITGARQVLERVPRGDLDAGDEERLADLWARVDDAEGVERLEREYAEHQSTGDLTGALAAATKLAEHAREHPEEDRSDWPRSVADLQADIRTTWKVEEVTAEIPYEEAIQPSHWLEPTAVWLDDEGRELVLVNGWDRWLFIDVIDVERRRVAARVSFQTPRPFERPLITRHHGESLWIAGRHGGLLQLARAGWNVLAYYDLTELVAEDRTVDRAQLIPGTPHVWMRVSEQWGREQVCIADLDRGRVVRRLPLQSASQVPILSGDEPRMLLHGQRVATRLYSAAGEPLGAGRLVKESVGHADVGPDGRGLLALLVTQEYDYDNKIDRELALVLMAEGPDGELAPAARLELDEAHQRFGFHDAVVSSPDRDTSYVYYYTKDESHELLVIPAADPESKAPLEPLSRTRWPGRTTLVQDRRGRHVAGIRIRAAGPELHALGASPEPPPAAPPAPKWDYPRAVVYSHDCGRPTDEIGAEVRKLTEELEERPDEALKGLLARTAASKDADADEQVRLALALLQRSLHYKIKDAIAEYARSVARRHPRHAGAVLLHADRRAVDESWDEVGRLLRKVKPTDLDDGRARHFHHLLGLVHLHAGRLDKACEAFSRGLEHEGTCKLEPLLHLTQPMANPPKAAEWSPDQPFVRRLLGAIRTADRAFEDGDPETARAALDRNDVRWIQDLQSAARRAHAYLETEAATAAQRFDERSALAFYADLRQQEKFMRQNLFLPGRHWDEERLEQIEVRVRQRLATLGER